MINKRPSIDTIIIIAVEVLNILKDVFKNKSKRRRKKK